jgi:hypothetical protein
MWGDFNSTPNSGIYEYILNGLYDCLSRKKNEISGQKYAFWSSSYEHRFFEDIPLEENIDKKHEKFLKVSQVRMKATDQAGNGTPFWVDKIQKTVVTGIGEDNQIQFSTRIDSQEIVEKFEKLDIALKKYSESAITDKKSKKQMKNMTEEEMNELLKEMPELVLHNPMPGIKSSYSKVMKDFLMMLSHSETIEEEYMEILHRELFKHGIVVEFLKKEVNKSKVFYGGFLPPLIQDDTNPIGIELNSFLKYWTELTWEPAYTYFTEMHGWLDYIWYHGEDLHPVRVLDVPNFYQELPFKIAPNEVIPSDHFPLMTEFVIK